MPELPEVETIVRDLRAKISDLTIDRFKIIDPRVIRQPIPKFRKALTGRTITMVERLGKAIVISLADPGPRYWVVQVMMTGQLIDAPSSVPNGPAKVIFTLSNGRYLHYNDQRLFGRLLVVDRLEEIGYFNILGVEPLSRKFTPQVLKQALSRRKGPIKSVLMNHQVVAGIGNIYASEILFRSRIRPTRSAAALSEKDIRTLHRFTRAVLQEAVELRGTSMHTYRDSDGAPGNFKQRIRVYGRAGDPCVNCKTPVSKLVQSGRSTFYCAQCQA